MSTIRLAVMVAAVFFGSHQAARAQSETELLTQLYLKDLRQVTLHLSFNSRPNCEYPAEQARADALNRLIPAGLSTNRDGINIVEISFTSISTTDHSCAASIDMRFISYDIVTVSNMIVPVSVWQAGGIISGPRNGFLNQSQEAVARYLDRFLARWREVNAGADFVRQAPRPAPAPPSRTAAPNQGAPAQTGPDIRTVQRRLQELGLYNGGIDGVAGPGTRQAVQAFQRSRQLPATGDLDLQTMRQLFP